MTHSQHEPASKPVNALCVMCGKTFTAPIMLPVPQDDGTVKVWELRRTCGAKCTADMLLEFIDECMNTPEYQEDTQS